MQGPLRQSPFLARTLMMHMVLCGWCRTSLSRLLGAAPGALGTAHSNNDLLEAILLEAGFGIGIGNETNSKLLQIGIGIGKFPPN